MKNRIILALFAIGAWLAPPEVGPQVVSQAFVVAALATVAILGTIASTTTSVVMQTQAAKAQEEAAKRQAENQRKQAYAEDERLRRLRKIHMRKLREGIGKSGIRGDIGTALDVQLDTASELEMDALNKRQTSLYNAAEFEASGLNQANAMRLGAVATGLQGATQLAQIGIGLKSLGGGAGGGDQSGGSTS